MNKQAFLAQLRKGLSGLPQKDIEEHVIFYSEMIDDRMEEGLSEEEAVSEVGPVEKIIAQLAEDANPPVEKRRLSPGEIILLVLGAPLWLPLLIAAVAVVVSVIVSLWSVFAAFVACVVGCTLGGILLAVGGKVAASVALLAVGMVFAGLSIFLFCGCKAVAKATVFLTKKLARWNKKGVAQ